MVYDAIFPYVKGGGERYFHEVAKQLALRHEVHLFGMRFWNGSPVQEIHPGVWAHGVCRAMPLYTTGIEKRRSVSQTLWFTCCLPWALLRGGHFDIIDCMSTPYFPLYSAKLTAMMKRTPLVSSWLEVWRGDSWKVYLGRYGGAVGRCIERFATNLPRHIVAISEHTREGLAILGVPPERISVVTPGIHWTEIQNVEAGEEHVEILFVGRLIPEKRVDVLLEAMARLCASVPDARCLLVGDGPARHDLENLVKRLRLGRNVRFAGFYPPRDVYRAMKASKVLVLPSQREGFGIVVLEAAASGLPVITIDDPNNASAQLVRSGKIGTVCRLDTEDLAKTMLLMLADEYARSETAAHAIRWSKQFDWPALAEKVEGIYDCLAHDG
jgi:glycosyltransferase involved in cell wall biosynthesis